MIFILEPAGIQDPGSWTSRFQYEETGTLTNNTIYEYRYGGGLPMRMETKEEQAKWQ